MTRSASRKTHAAQVGFTFTSSTPYFSFNPALQELHAKHQVALCKPPKCSCSDAFRPECTKMLPELLGRILLGSDKAVDCVRNDSFDRSQKCLCCSWHLKIGCYVEATKHIHVRVSHTDQRAHVCSTPCFVATSPIVMWFVSRFAKTLISTSLIPEIAKTLISTSLIPEI
jgi:hypothetical protein